MRLFVLPYTLGIETYSKLSEPMTYRVELCISPYNSDVRNLILIGSLRFSTSLCWVGENKIKIV